MVNLGAHRVDVGRVTALLRNSLRAMCKKECRCETEYILIYGCAHAACAFDISRMRSAITVKPTALAVRKRTRSSLRRMTPLHIRRRCKSRKEWCEKRRQRGDLLAVRAAFALRGHSEPRLVPTSESERATNTVRSTRAHTHSYQASQAAGERAS